MIVIKSKKIVHQSKTTLRRTSSYKIVRKSILAILSSEKLLWCIENTLRLVRESTKKKSKKNNFSLEKILIQL